MGVSYRKRIGDTNQPILTGISKSYWTKPPENQMVDPWFPYDKNGN